MFGIGPAELVSGTRTGRRVVAEVGRHVALAAGYGYGHAYRSTPTYTPLLGALRWLVEVHGW